MTTGTDYATQSIALKPPDGSRSTAELVELERTSGYSDMTDAEISRLIEYKEFMAQQDKLIEDNRAHNETMLEQAKEAAEQQLQQSREFFEKVLNTKPSIVSVTGNEVD